MPVKIQFAHQMPAKYILGKTRH